MKIKKLKMVIYEKPKKPKKWTFENLEKGFFSAGKNTSRDIDKIVYGL